MKPECMGKNFFWWTYSGAYEGKSESSCINQHEAGMVTSLCCWLVCNDEKSSSIAVLTPYRGQVHTHTLHTHTLTLTHTQTPHTHAHTHTFHCTIVVVCMNTIMYKPLLVHHMIGCPLVPRVLTLKCFCR